MATEHEPESCSPEQIAATAEMIRLMRPDLSDELAVEVAEAVIPPAMESARMRAHDEKRTDAARKRVAEVIASAESQARQA